jgi:hypothetical protein
LERVQQRTIDLTEFVEGGLKQRDAELRRLEHEMLKRERQLADEDEIAVTLEEKKMEEEERRLQRLKEEFAKVKSIHRDELARLMDSR